MSGHTPGPWAVTKGSPRKVTANGVLICNAVLRNSATTKQNAAGKGEEKAKANARLIAAAPELLEALEVIAPMLDYLPHPHCVSAINSVRAAITAATGDAA